MNIEKLHPDEKPLVSELFDDSVGIHAASLIAAEDKRKEAQVQAWKKYEQTLRERECRPIIDHWAGYLAEVRADVNAGRGETSRAFDEYLVELFARRRNWRYRLVRCVRKFLHL